MFCFTGKAIVAGVGGRKDSEIITVYASELRRNSIFYPEVGPGSIDVNNVAFLVNLSKQKIFRLFPISIKG